MGLRLYKNFFKIFNHVKIRDGLTHPGPGAGCIFRKLPGLSRGPGKPGVSKSPGRETRPGVHTCCRPSFNRIFPVFPGRNTIFCGGACIMAADTTVFYITTFLIVLCGAMFFAFESPLTYARTDLIPYGYMVS